MSDTPRTDALMADLPEDAYCHPADAIELAKKLERENATLRHLLKLALPHVPASAVDPERVMNHPVDECRITTMIVEVLKGGSDV